jgi:hypothetical protein
MLGHWARHRCWGQKRKRLRWRGLSVLRPRANRQAARLGLLRATSQRMHSSKQHLSDPSSHSVSIPAFAGSSDSMCSLSSIPSLTLGRSCARHALRSRRACRHRRAACHPCCAGPGGRFHEGDRPASIGWQPHSASGISGVGDQNKAMRLGNPRLQRPRAYRRNPNCQTVIGTEAAPRECRRACRPTAASIGPGPTG